MSNDIYKSYVYLFVMNDQSAFKIGKSDNPLRRFNTLKTQYNFNESFNIIECDNSKKAFELEHLLQNTFTKFNCVIDDSREFFEYNIYSSVCDLISNFTNHSLQYIDINNRKDPLNDIELNKENLILFSELIKTRRKELGYNQQDFAKEIGCARSTLQKIESTSSFNESLKLYTKIADLLSITISFK